MISVTGIARLQTLKHSLGVAVNLIRELDTTRVMVQFAQDDPERWTYLIDSLSAGMEPGEIGSIQQVLTALDGALDG